MCRFDRITSILSADAVHAGPLMVQKGVGEREKKTRRHEIFHMGHAACLVTRGIRPYAPCHYLRTETARGGPACAAAERRHLACGAKAALRGNALPRSHRARSWISGVRSIYEP